MNAEPVDAKARKNAKGAKVGEDLASVSAWDLTYRCALCGESGDRRDNSFESFRAAAPEWTPFPISTGATKKALPPEEQARVHAFFPPDDALYPFRNADFHRACFEGWPLRAEFRRRWFGLRCAKIDADPMQGIAFRGEHAIVVVAEHHEKIVVHLESGSGSGTLGRDWEAWVSGDLPWGAKWKAGLDPADQAIVSQLQAELREHAPDFVSLLARVDWVTKDRLRSPKQRDVVATAAEQARLRPLRAAEAARLNALRREAFEAGAQCPHCRERDRIRVVESYISYCVCRACARSFNVV